MLNLLFRCDKKHLKTGCLLFNNKIQKCHCEYLHRLKRSYSSKNITPLLLYSQRVNDGSVSADSYQEKIVHALEKVHKNVQNFSRPTQNGSKTGFGSNFMNKPPIVNAPKGLYIYGSVGCGKTMLMDLFYDTVQTAEKRRVHFNAFMLDIHARIHQMKTADPSRTSFREGSTYFDPIPSVASYISNETWLICFDEFQVTDIGDAMILKLLFTRIFENGCVVVATSNRHPNDLYKNGLQRSKFLPFIQVLQSHCDVIELNSGIDYRQKSNTIGGGGHGTYFTTSQITPGNNPVNILFKQLCANENDVVRPRTISIMGRNVDFKIACGQVLDTTFVELCDRPLGASDYIMLGNTFHTIIIRDVPRLNLSMKSQARRFITLIDTLYDKRVRLVIVADVPLKELFSSTTSDDMRDDDRTLMDDLDIKIGSENASASIFTGEEEVFAFDRCISRIYEMQTPEYWSKWEKFR